MCSAGLALFVDEGSRAERRLSKTHRWVNGIIMSSNILVNQFVLHIAVRMLRTTATH
jgi:hypothetical protein